MTAVPLPPVPLLLEPMGSRQRLLALFTMAHRLTTLGVVVGVIVNENNWLATPVQFKAWGRLDNEEDPPSIQIVELLGPRFLETISLCEGLVDAEVPEPD